MRPVNQSPVPPLPPAPDAAGHLALPLLRQYVAGTLPAATQHRIEAHTLDCARCAEILDGLQVSDPATTDAALRQLQARLHQRLAQAETPHRTRQLWQAAAAVLLLLLVSTAVWWQVRRPQTELASAPVAMQTTPAPPAESPVAPTPPAGAAAAEAAPAATESAAAVALATPTKRPTNYRRAPRSARTRPATRVAADTEAAAAAKAADEAKSAALAAVAADEAPAAVAMRAAAPAVAARAAVVPAAADTGAAVAAAQARSTQRVAEESVARKPALPPPPTFSPQPVGGYIGLREYLRREGLFVPEPPTRQLSGSVRVQFTVTATGKLENFRILRGIRADYDAEAIRLLCEGPTWQPGTANGRRADQVVEINISF